MSVKQDCFATDNRYACFMKAVSISLLATLLALFVVRNSALAVPSEPAQTNLTPPVQSSTLQADGIRPEDVMIDDDAIGDVWDSVSPADAIGITKQDADVLPTVTAALSSVELLKEKELLAPAPTKTAEPRRVRTQRWRPNVPIQTLFYLALAVVVVVVLLLKAKES